MTNTEKIANAKKRIDELERLIKYWNDSERDESKIVNFKIKPPLCSLVALKRQTQKFEKDINVYFVYFF